MRSNTELLRMMNATNGPELTEKHLAARQSEEPDQDEREAQRRFFRSKYYRLAFAGTGQQWIKDRLMLPSMIEVGADSYELVVSAKRILYAQGNPVTGNAIRSLVRQGYNVCA